MIHLGSCLTLFCRLNNSRSNSFHILGDFSCSIEWSMPKVSFSSLCKSLSDDSSFDLSSLRLSSLVPILLFNRLFADGTDFFGIPSFIVNWCTFESSSSRDSNILALAQNLAPGTLPAPCVKLLSIIFFSLSVDISLLCSFLSLESSSILSMEVSRNLLLKALSSKERTWGVWTPLYWYLIWVLLNGSSLYKLAISFLPWKLGSLWLYFSLTCFSECSSL